jgi:hypothetical protein
MFVSAAIPSPRPGVGLVDEYFIENRTRLLEVASYLDRLDRSGDAAVAIDFRMRAFREALAVLCERESGRVERIQMIFSDPTTEPRAALDQKGAKGAFDRWKEQP